MKTYFRFLPLFVFISLVFPLAAQSAGLVPCGQSRDDVTTLIQENAPCTLCHFFMLIKRIIDFLTGRVAIGFLILAVIGSGVMFLLSSGDETRVRQARGILEAGVIGFAIVLLGWLIINTIIVFATEGSIAGAGKVFGKAWNEIPCNVPKCNFNGVCEDKIGECEYVPGKTYDPANPLSESDQGICDGCNSDLCCGNEICNFNQPKNNPLREDPSNCNSDCPCNYNGKCELDVGEGPWCKDCR